MYTICIVVFGLPETLSFSLVELEAGLLDRSLSVVGLLDLLGVDPPPSILLGRDRDRL